MHLPPEILHQVLLHLDRLELRAVRLVCKSLEQAVVCLFFDQLTISNNYTSIQNAKLALARFSPFIKTIIVRPSECDAEHAQWFYTQLSSAYCTAPPSPSTRLIGGCDLFQIYDDYCVQYLEKEDIKRTGVFYEALCAVFSNAPNARRLVFSKPTKPDKKQFSDMVKCGLNNLHRCKDRECALEAREHFQLLLGKEFGFHRRSGRDLFDSVMKALSKSGSQITEIDMDTGKDRSWYDCFCRCTFGSRTLDGASVRDRLKNLTKLHIQITQDRCTKKYLYRDDHCVRERDCVAKVLAWASNLKSLYLGGWCEFEPEYDWPTDDEADSADLRSLLGGCHFPKLQTLILHNLTATEDHLFRFLQGSSSLKTLCLSPFLLRSGSWESAILKLSRNFQMNKVILQSIRGSKERTIHCPHQGYWFLDDHDRVDENYFIHGVDLLSYRSEPSRPEPYWPELGSKNDNDENFLESDDGSDLDDAFDYLDDLEWERSKLWTRKSEHLDRLYYST
ncbi:hypothetical protein ACLMJK_008236 [Lecanora helva]